MEILSPAGSPEAVQAAVYAGADAVYLGYGPFNARRNARNFDQEELQQAIDLCHLYGVKVYLTLNTLASDREVAQAAQVAVEASSMGVDAILVQDMGLLQVVGQVAPDVHLHASTQMTIHNLDGVKRCADLGLTRAVLSRELSRKEISYICDHSPIEIETFVHGALCMCYSGQCFFSSVLGGRSGNRGLCAQPCRLSYGWNGKADRYPLSLKDMSLAGHLRELQDMGVACAKIEGRMKRPEYVWVVTKVYADALREGREPTAEEVAQLTAAFSRQGFTDGYFTGNQGAHMFGVREQQPEPRELFAAARAGYDKPTQLVPVTLHASIQAGQPACLTLTDEDGHTVTVTGPAPEQARTRALEGEDVAAQLSKTGGTPYRVAQHQVEVGEGLSLPRSALNALRREGVEQLSAARTALPQRRHFPYEPLPKVANPTDAPALHVTLRSASQCSPALLDSQPARIALPVDEAASHPDVVADIQAHGIQAAVVLPRICWDGGEMDTLKDQLTRCRDMGVTHALVGNLGLLDVARDLGFTLHGDYGLEVFNSHGVKAYRELGLASLTASFELKLAQIRDLSKTLPVELLAYGRLPLMITENCAMKAGAGQCCCGNGNTLTDRRGVGFPVMKAWGCRNEIFNSDTLFLADKAGDYLRAGVSALNLLFTTEDDHTVVDMVQRYQGVGNAAPASYTRGLYYRDVE
ncbi:U32 family peptidase [Pseudoflavonifractor sp. An85]|uniref:U32 family peptidase n=1 Tax=Pseudoflavonifractor sp. An85 TaxID=1965661 RepID=UPI000B3AB71C|nr:U32 family peptidase [Pseudoflavonifractor sp. An85]OUN21762.1 peptidase U32 [Pseudoflavonifractor sp. An85]